MLENQMNIGKYYQYWNDPFNQAHHTYEKDDDPTNKNKKIITLSIETDGYFIETIS
jgi:hypothetical protein